MEAVKQDMFLDELNNILGLGQMAKDGLTSYAEYIALRKKGQIADIASYNIFLEIQEEYVDTEQIINFICNTLKYNNVVDDEDCYEIKQSEITRKLDKIDKKLIIVSDKVNLNMLGTIDLLSQFIKDNKDKIFIVVYSSDRIRGFSKPSPIEQKTEPLFDWRLKVTGTYTIEEIRRWIQQKLKQNHIKISEKCNLVDELIKIDMPKIESEILYLSVKCKADNVRTINDQFLQKVHRSRYLPKTKVGIKSAMQELDELIGLEPIKAQIKQIINYVKVNKSRGQLPMLHMCFMGSSGSR